MTSLHLDSSVSGHVFKDIKISLSDDEQVNITRFIKIYYFGDDEITNEEILDYPNDVVEGYTAALGRLRGGWSTTLSMSFNHNGNPCIKISEYDIAGYDEIDKIKEQIGCSSGCAIDVYLLRRKLDWTREQELELINTHNAGVPSHVSLYSALI